MTNSSYGSTYRQWLRTTLEGMFRATWPGPGLVFVNRIRESAEVAVDVRDHLMECLRWTPEEAAERIEVVTGEMPLSWRQQVANRIRGGWTGPWVTVCTQAWATGIDIPPVRWVVLDPGLGTPVPTVQSAGRASRPLDGKPDYLVIVPPQSKRRGAQLEALREAGYDMGSPTPAVRLAIADAFQKDVEGARAMPKARWDAKPLGWAGKVAEQKQAGTGGWAAGEPLPTAKELFWALLGCGLIGAVVGGVLDLIARLSGISGG